MSADGSVRLDNYDFIDIGSSKGAGIVFGREKLGGNRGLAVDANPVKVKETIDAGFDALHENPTRLDPDQLGTTRFAQLIHFLQRQQSIEGAAECIHSAVGIADEYVFIRQPFFDADEYLSSLGLRLFWSNWRSNKFHMRQQDFHEILGDLLARRKIQRFILFHRSLITDSTDPAVHPLSSPVNQHQWDPAKHETKSTFKFHIPVYREIGAVIHTRSKKLDEKPRRYLLSCNVVYDSGK
jgi:hypothetical protein